MIVPACRNVWLSALDCVLRATLNGEWGLAGFVISDADAVALVGKVPDQGPKVDGHGFAPSLYEAAIGALLNGTTISLEDADPDSNAYASQLPLALAAGRISLSDLRAAARRALLPRFRVGLYDDPAAVPWNAVNASVIEGPAAHALARRAAAASYVLVKNDAALLPFRSAAAGGPRHIAVVGTA